MFVLNASSGTISIAFTVDVTRILVISESSVIIWYKMSAVMVKRWYHVVRYCSAITVISKETIIWPRYHHEDPFNLHCRTSFTPLVL